VYKKTKRLRLSRKSLLFLVTILIVLTVLITGIVMISTKKREIKDTLTTMPFSTNNLYFPVGETIIYSDNELLTCVNASLDTIWQLKLFTGGLNYATNDDLIAATGDNVIQVVNAKGDFLFQTQLDGMIKSVRPAKDKLAVSIDQVLTDKTLSYIIVFDLSGNSIFQIDVSKKYVLDYGFDSNNKLLYILELDVSGAAPVSRISTYRPETQSMTGIKEFKDQLIESIYMINDEIYAIGTNHLTMYTSLNSTDREVMTYGWVLEDIDISRNPKFVYIPGFWQNEIDMIRVIKDSGDETTINLPPNVFSVLHKGEKIYCFATDSIFVYTGDGKYFRTYALPFEIERVERAMNGYVFITKGDTIFLMPLP
jgi:hypothetical protein